MSSPAPDSPDVPASSPVAVVDAPAPKLDERTKQLPPFNVVLLDDDHHTYEYVIELAMKLFAHPRERAYDIAKMVDTQKRAVLVTTHKEHAELKREQVHGYGRDFRMQSSVGSMSCIIEPAFADGDTNESNNNNGQGNGQGNNA